MKLVTTFFTLLISTILSSQINLEITGLHPVNCNRETISFKIPDSTRYTNIEWLIVRQPLTGIPSTEWVQSGATLIIEELDVDQKARLHSDLDQESA